MNFQDFKKKYQKTEVEEISFASPKEPVVSVLVQTYQQKDFIKECLDSILMQKTKFEFEILVGDDGSTDGTREICLEYAKKYPDKIRLFLHHRENQIKVMGEATSNFNAFYNFFSARGKFIAFCEGDDKWTDTKKLQKQVRFLENNSSYSFTYHLFKAIDERGNSISVPLQSDQPTIDLRKELLLKGAYHPLLLTICFKKDTLNIPEEIFKVLNVDTFLLSLFGEVGDAKFLNEIKPSLYRFRTEGLWSKKIRSRKLVSKIRTYHFLASYFKRTTKPEREKFYLYQLKLHYKMLFVSYLRDKKLVLAGKSLLDYIKIK